MNFQFIKRNRKNMSRPTGVTALGVLNILGGIGWLGMSLVVSILGNIISSSIFSGLASFANTIAVFVIVGAIIHFIIAGALFTGKNSARIIVIVFSIIHLLLSIFSLISGNIFALFSIIFDSIVLYYMWRPHVVSYFKGSNGTDKFYCKHCLYAAPSYIELRDHQENCSKRQEEDQPKAQQRLDSFVSENKNDKQSAEKETINTIAENERILGIAKERFAKGEITKDEYIELKKELV